MKGRGRRRVGAGARPQPRASEAKWAGPGEVGAQPGQQGIGEGSGLGGLDESRGS